MKAMVTSKPITPTKGSDSYMLTFKYPEHLAVSVGKYNAHKQTKPNNRINNFTPLTKSV